MSNDNWIVEEEMIPNAPLDVRETYIKLLRKMIDALKETEMFRMGDNENKLDISLTYSLPTVIFAYLDTEQEQGKTFIQFRCYRDRLNFLKDLESYGDEEHLKKYGLESFIRKGEPKKNS